MFKSVVTRIQNYLAGVPLALLSGGLLGCSFIHAPLWPFSFLGGACFIALVFNMQYTHLRVFLLSWIVGFITIGCAVYGLYWHTLPLTWLGLGEESLWQMILVFFMWAYTAIFIALSYGVWALAVRLLHTQTWMDIVVIPAFWVFAELLGALIFYIQQYGPGGGFFSISYTYQFIGYQLASSPVLLQLASVGGVFILSMTTMIVATVLYRMYITRKGSREKRMLTGLLLGFFIIWVGGHYLVSTTHVVDEYAESEKILFGVASTHMMGLRDTKTQLAIHKSLVEGLEVDVVVLPEGAELLSKMDEHNEAYPTSAGLYIDSTTVYDEEGIASARANYYSPTSEEVRYGYKFLLMPVGEYVPSIITFISWITGFDKTETFDHMLKYSQYVPRGYPEVVSTPDGAVLGMLFCNEKLSPTLYQSLTREGAEVLVNISSHLWFNQSQVVFDRQVAMSKVRAVESDRWYVQADNMAPSYILDNYGNIVLVASWESDAVLRTEVPLLHTVTPYVRLGLWVLAVPGAIVLLSMASAIKRRGIFFKTSR